MDKSNSSKLYDVLNSKDAPNHIGKPVFRKDLELARMLVGSKTGSSMLNLQSIFGKRLPDNDETTVSCPLNFGSRKSLTINPMTLDILPEDTRIRLFQWKKALSNVEIQAQIKSGQDRYTKVPSLEIYKSVPSWGQFESMSKAFDISSWGEWIDTIQARFFFEEYEVEYLLADQFDNMPMTSPIVRVPGALGLLEGELESDTGIFTAQSNTESSYLVESKNNVVHSQITQDLLDDSAPPLIDKQRKETVKGIVRSYERCLLDGTKAGSVHIDADTELGSSKLYTKAWDGLRRKAFENETLTGSTEQIVFDHNDTPSKDMFSKLLKKLKCQGAEKPDLFYILGCSSGHDLVTGAIPELFTAFAFGSVASNVSGNTPPVFGINVVESQLVREDLETTGKALAVPADTKTYAMLVQKSRFSNWTRQATKVWAAPSLPSSDNMLMSGKARHTWNGVPQTANERSVTMAINVKTQ